MTKADFGRDAMKQWRMNMARSEAAARDARAQSDRSFLAMDDCPHGGPNQAGARGSTENDNAWRRAALVLAGGGIKRDDAAFVAGNDARDHRRIDDCSNVVDRQDRGWRLGQRAKYARRLR
jgi:hypothetical protein